MKTRNLTCAAAFSMVSLAACAAPAEQESRMDGAEAGDIAIDDDVRPMEHTNRNDVRGHVAAGGWDIVWGDLINEADVFTGIAAYIAGIFPVWVDAQIDAQLDHFARSAGDVSKDVLKRALKQAFNGGGEVQISPHLGVKAGFATYKRWDFVFNQKVAWPNNHQPFVAFRLLATPPVPPPAGADVEAEIGIVRANAGERFRVSTGGGVARVGAASWNTCSPGFQLVGTLMDPNGMWLCARSDLAGNAFYVGNVVAHSGASYRVARGGVSGLGAASWNTCPAGSRLVGGVVEANGFWICRE